MATDYTIIQAVRQHFGDNKPDYQEFYLEAGATDNAPFVSASKDFSFNCPSIDRSHWAILQFMAFGVSTAGNVIQINGVDVPGGITFSPAWPGDPKVIHEVFFGEDIVDYPPVWNVHSLLVEGTTLGEQNVLHIESKEVGFPGTLDDFVLDNIVIWFKTRSAIRPPDVGPAKQ